MDLSEFLLCVLAVWQAVEIWHHGSLFASARARLEVQEGWLADLLLCPFCLSVHVAWIIVLGYWISPWLPLGSLFRLIVFALAVSRVANLLNDLAHPISRTPGSSD